MTTTALGKRKEREEDAETSDKTHGSTLFVSNLPYTATSVDLQTLFSEIAPVRSAFVVTEQGTGVSKGVGYVSFAIKEDAEMALVKIENEGLQLVNRSLRVQWADSKLRHKEKQPADGVKKEKKERKEPKTAAQKAPHVKLPHDPNAIRTIVVSGLPDGLDSNALWKKMRKYTGAEKVEWPIEADNGVVDPKTAHVIFKTPSSANNAVTKLHAHVFKGFLLSVTLKKRLENFAKPIARPPANSKSKPGPETEVSSGVADAKLAKSAIVTAPSHASRLIVRNIPFDTTEQDLRAVFLPYGPIYSIHIPLDAKGKEKQKEAAEAADSSVANANANAKPRTKGFAFVWMLSRKDAEKAIEKCNGIEVSAGVAQTLVSDKQKKKKLRRLEKKKKAQDAAAAAANGTDPKEDTEKDKASDEGEASDSEDDDAKPQISTSRVIAVDWALSKDKWEEEKAKIEEQKEDVEMSDGDGENSGGSGSDDGSNDSAAEDGDMGKLGVHHGSDNDESGENDGSEDDGSDADEQVKPKLPDTDVGTTIFIRNVPFTATDEELRALFRSFGPLRYARITMDQATERSRGTGFACFWNKEDADKVIEQSNLLREITTGTQVKPVKNPFTLPSLLTPDPSTSLAQSLVLQGRTLDCVRAVTRDVASKLQEQGEKSREKADKRNMYLLKEGVILANVPRAAELSPSDLERRTNSYNARRQLLKSNPSLYVSKSRLSIRQIPLFVSERMLKRLSIHAVRAFEAEVKAGGRKGLTEDEKSAEHDVQGKGKEGAAEKDEEAEGDDEGEAEKKSKKKKKFGRETGVKQTKIVRQQDRVDPLSGKGRSKGYGFVEMHKHADALRVLRWANDNLSVGSLFDKWWKEELADLAKRLEATLKSKGKGKPDKKPDEKSDEKSDEKPEEYTEKDREMDEARLGRIKAEIEKGGQGRPTRGGGLIAEFSIENIQVVQRRNAVQKGRGKPREVDQDSQGTPAESLSKSGLKRSRTEDHEHDDQGRNKKHGRPSPNKKRRLSSSTLKDENSKSSQKGTPSKAMAKAKGDTSEKTEGTADIAPTKKEASNPLGGVIGRKRKERKMKKVGKR